LEFFEAHLRASGNLAIFANMRAESPESLAKLLFDNCSIAGCRSQPFPGFTPVIHPPIGMQSTLSSIAMKSFSAVNELRTIGGSGVVVMPVLIFLRKNLPVSRLC